MNERIKELAYQAEDYADSIVDQGGEFHQAYTQKLAELIVLECARIAAQTPFPDADEDVRKTFGHTWDMACVESAKDIRKHFGVK